MKNPDISTNEESAKKSQTILERLTRYATKPITAKRFLAILGLTFGLLIVLTGAFNIIVDADGIFNMPRIPGFNAKKTQIAFQSQAFQPIILAWRKPQAIVLGASRAGSGMRAKFLPWSKTLNTYIAAIEGSGTYTELRTYQHAQAVSHGGVKKVLYTLDFISFEDNSSKNKPNSPFNLTLNPLLAAHPDGTTKPLYIFKLVSTTLKYALSASALSRSIQTLRTQDSPHFTLHTDGSFPPIDNKSRNYRGIHLAMTRALSNTLWFQDGNFTMRPNGPALRYYSRLLTRLHQDHVQTVLMISPIHADLLSAIYDAGLWPCFQRWKRSLLRVDRRVAARFNAKPFALWDFAYASPSTLERVPPPGKEAKVGTMKYWWDSAHYKATLGRIVTNRIFDSKKNGKDDNAYGVLLNSVNMKAWQARVTAGRSKFASRQPQLAKAIHRTINKTKAGRDPKISCPAYQGG